MIIFRREFFCVNNQSKMIDIIILYVYLKYFSKNCENTIKNRLIQKNKNVFFEEKYLLNKKIIKIKDKKSKKKNCNISCE